MPGQRRRVWVDGAAAAGRRDLEVDAEHGLVVEHQTEENGTSRKVLETILSLNFYDVF